MYLCLYGQVRFTEECYIGDARQGGRGRRAAEHAGIGSSRQESMAAAEVMQLLTYSQLDIRENERGSTGRGGCS